MRASGSRGRAFAEIAPVALVAVGLLVWPAIATAAPSEFSGSCSFAGPITPMPPITVVPGPGAHFSYHGAGSCDGMLDSTTVAKAPIVVAFTDVATLFDTCEIGPDFDLSGSASIGAAPHQALFAITINLARVAVAGPFSLSTSGGGQALGVAQFAPSDPAAAAQQCASGGVSSASLAASFNTVSPLVGVRVTPSAPPTQQATVAPSAAPSTGRSTHAVKRRHRRRRAARNARRCAHRRACRPRGRAR